jgi:hexosaminidase
VPSKHLANITLPAPIQFVANATFPMLLKVIGRSKPLIFPCSKSSLHIPTVGRLSGATTFQGTRVSILVASQEETLSINTNEKYSIEIEIPKSKNQLEIKVVAATVFGVKHALETLAQVIHPVPKNSSFIKSSWSNCQRHAIPFAPLKIVDWPRTSHRGLLLDTARHFIPINTIKTILDGMSATKLNVFHWHITDGQSFPLWLPSIPELAEKGASSPQEIYRPEEVKELIEYAYVISLHTVIVPIYRYLCMSQCFHANSDQTNRR